jgi:hypothetical protein
MMFAKMTFSFLHYSKHAHVTPRSAVATEIKGLFSTLLCVQLQEEGKVP